MFKLAQQRSIEWPVTVNIPVDGGKTQKAKFTGEFLVLSQDEIDAVVLGRDERGRVDLLDVVLTGWRDDVRNEAGEELPFTDENKAALIGIPYVRAGLFAAYGEIQNGRGARKN